MKTFCVLEQGSEINAPLTLQKKEMFSTDFSDFYWFNWKRADDPNTLLTAKNTIWSEGRSLLYQHVPKNYDYYIFADDDIQFSAAGGINIAIRIKELLEEYKPLAGTFLNPHRWLARGRRGLYPYREMTVDDCLSKICFPHSSYDSEVQIYSRSFADVMLPEIYHGTYWSMLFCQGVCSKLFPLKQVCFTEIQIGNMAHRGHNHESKMTNHFTRHEILYLHSKNIKGDDSFLKKDKRLMIPFFNYVVDKTEVIFTIGDLAKIYNINNYGFKNRAAKPPEEFARNIRNWKFRLGMIWFRLTFSEIRSEKINIVKKIVKRKLYNSLTKIPYVKNLWRSIKRN